MTDERERQLERFGEAVEEKKRAAKEASEQPAEGQEGPPAAEVAGDQEGLYSSDRPQDAQSVRAKNAGKGKKTADKWNQ